MKIISNSKWDSINSQIKSLKEQVSNEAEEYIKLNNEFKESTKKSEEMIRDNTLLSQGIADLDAKLKVELERVKNLKKDNKLLKTLCTKNGINYNEVLMSKPKDKK